MSSSSSKFSSFLLIALILISSLKRDVEGLAVTVNDVECVYEYVPYEGDTVSGNFVVVDHDIYWNADHPGIDLVVSNFFFDFVVDFLPCEMDLLVWCLIRLNC